MTNPLRILCVIVVWMAVTVGSAVGGSFVRAETSAAPAQIALAPQRLSPQPDTHLRFSIGFIYNLYGVPIGGFSVVWGDTHHVRVGCGDGVIVRIVRDGPWASSGYSSRYKCPYPLKAHWVSRKCLSFASC